MTSESKKRLLVAGILAAGLLIITVLTETKNGFSPDTVTITFTGYTNFPGNTLPYGLFVVSNQTAGDIRWRDDWEEAAGDSDHWARTIDSRFPQNCRFDPVLKCGKSFSIAVGELPVAREPYNSDPNGRWRFTLAYVPNSFKVRMVDYGFAHHISWRIGSFSLLNDQKVLDPANDIEIHSIWLEKRNRLPADPVKPLSK